MPINFILASVFTFMLALITFAFGAMFYNEKIFNRTFGRIESLSPKMRHVAAIISLAIVLILAAVALSVFLALAEK